MDTKKQPSILLFERIKTVINKELALKLRLSPANQPVAGKNGRPQNFPREIVQIAQVLHRSGAAVNRVTQKEIIRVACEVIDLDKPEKSTADNGEAEPAQPAKQKRTAAQPKKTEKKAKKQQARKKYAPAKVQAAGPLRGKRGGQEFSVPMFPSNPAEALVSKLEAEAQDEPRMAQDSQTAENVPDQNTDPQTSTERDPQIGGSLEPDVVPTESITPLENTLTEEHAPDVALPDQPPAPATESFDEEAQSDEPPDTPTAEPGEEGPHYESEAGATAPVSPLAQVHNETKDVLSLYLLCYTNTAAVADLVETHDKGPGHEDRLRLLTRLVNEFRALAKTTQNKSNSDCASAN